MPMPQSLAELLAEHLCWHPSASSARQVIESSLALQMRDGRGGPAPPAERVSRSQ